MEVLYCFDNESFCLNGRKYKLPAFREVMPVHLAGGAEGLNVFKASSQQGAWFIVFKENNLSEGHINSLLTESKKMSEKPQQRILISLSMLDDAARLKALQEKMWIWKEEELNALFNLLDKPYIVL